MRLIKETHIDFMKYRKIWIAVSLVLVLGGVLSVFFKGWIKAGIDFAGGTQVHLRFKQTPDIDRLRGLLDAAGFSEVSITTFGEAANHEVLVRTPLAEGSEEGSRDQIVAALGKAYNAGSAGKVDLNSSGADTTTQLLVEADPDGVAAQGPEAARVHYEEVARTIVTERAKEGILTNWKGLASAGIDGKTLQTLQARAHLGEFSVIGVESVGPQIGKELRGQGLWAVALSLLGMLVYIAFRFELRFGIGAVMASLHDVLVTLGLFALFKFEFNLTTVAAFLTLVGYSVNDTVVIFDRVRENMRKSKRKPLIELLNESLNQTLARTFLTAGLTLLTTASLLFFGGDVLRGFAFVMTVGILIGTYSSIYIASPFALLWEHYFGTEAKAKRAATKRASAQA